MDDCLTSATSLERLSRLYTAWNDHFPDPGLRVKAAGFAQTLGEIDANPPDSR